MNLNNNDTAEEIKSLTLQINSIGDEIKRGIPNFKQTYKNCDFVSEFQGQGLMTPQYLRLVCEKGYDYFKNYILNPLLNNLLNYRDYLIGTKAYTGSFKPQVQGLISSIHRYVIVSTFFGKNPSYMVPGSGAKELDAQKQFKDIILNTNRRLMGCDTGSKFPIQGIAKKMGMEGDHQKILDYMNLQCSFLRGELLK